MKLVARLLAGLALAFALFAAPQLALSAATLDRAVCSTADKAGGNPALCEGQELIDSANQEISHAYDIGAQPLTSTTGTGALITGCTTPTTTALVDGALYQIKPPADSTGPDQLNLCSLGAKPITTAAGVALSAGDLLQTSVYIARYYAANDQFRILTMLGNGLVGGGGGASTSATYLTVGAQATLTGSRAITPGTGITGTDGGGGSTYTLSLSTNGVTNTQLAQMAASSVKCNTTGSLANAADCTPAQVSSLLNSTIAPPWTSITSKPTTLSGFGITDGQPLDADLTALAGNSTAGFWAYTGAGTGAARTITGTAGEITVTNGAGTAGNPTLSIPSAVTFTGKTVTGGTYTGAAVENSTIGATTPSTGVFTTASANTVAAGSGRTAGPNAPISNILNAFTPTAQTAATTSMESAMRLLHSGTGGVKYDQAVELQVGTKGAGLNPQTRFSVLANNGATNSVDTTLLTLDADGAVSIPGSVTGNLKFAGATSGTTTLAPTAVAGTTTLTMPAATDQLVARATVDTLTNKSIALGSNTLSGTSAQLATALSDETGTGLAVFGTSPALTTPAIGSGGFTIAGATSGTTTLNTSAVASGTMTVPAGTDTLAGTALTQTLTNKTINLTSNTLTATSAQMATAITDETGTGAAVFATSPALVTPNLGTPSAATLTNATGLPVATGISGLATGVATALATPSSANLAAAITDETGTGLSVFATSPSLTTPTIGGAGANFAGATSGTTALKAAAVAGATTLTLPAATDTLTANATAATLTNKSIDLGGNTLTATSAQLATAISDETGTGAAVFATSPSLTTPNLGTPSAANLANATNLPIGSIAALGTGEAAALGIAANASGGHALVSGVITAGNCLKWAAGGIQDAGAACGTGGGGGGTAVIPGYLSGYTLSNNVTTPASDIDIATGYTTADNDTDAIQLVAGMTKRLDVAWASGSGVGGLDTGTVANGTYHVFVIKRTDTNAVDVLFSANATAPTMPSPYTVKRRIGSIIRSAGAIRPFTQTGNRFVWKTPVLDVDAASAPASAVVRTLSVPTGVIVTAIVNVFQSNAVNGVYTYLSALNQADVATNTVQNGTMSGPETGGHGYGGTQESTTANIDTNSSAQIRSRASIVGGATDRLSIWTIGWIDNFAPGSIGTGGAVPGGTSGQMQVNNAGAFSGISTTGTGNAVLATSPTLTTPIITAAGETYNGATSGTTTLAASAVASGALTLPAATDTLVGKATTDTFTNKSINLSSNTLTATSAQMLAAISDETGTGAAVFAGSPALTTPNIGSGGLLIAGATSGQTTVNTSAVASGTVTIPAGTDTLVNLAAAQTLTSKTLTSPTINTATIAGGTINSASVGATTASTGAFTTLTASGAVTLSPASAAVAISPTGTGTVAISPVGALTINPTAASTINNTSIGATTASTGRFTTVTSTIATGTAPFTVTSTTNVPNLNASSLNGATFAAPGPIGSTTAGTGAFTTLSANSAITYHAPVTVTTATYTVLATDYAIIFNGTAASTFTLGTATAGRTLKIKSTAAFAVNSATANVVPLAGGAAATAITAATAGKFVELVGDGTNWIVMAGN